MMRSRKDSVRETLMLLRRLQSEPHESGYAGYTEYYPGSEDSCVILTAPHGGMFSLVFVCVCWFLCVFVFACVCLCVRLFLRVFVFVCFCSYSVSVIYAKQCLMDLIIHYSPYLTLGLLL